MQLAELAGKAKPGLLILYHRSNLGGVLARSQIRKKPFWKKSEARMRARSWSATTSISTDALITRTESRSAHVCQYHNRYFDLATDCDAVSESGPASPAADAAPGRPMESVERIRSGTIRNGTDATSLDGPARRCTSTLSSPDTARMTLRSRGTISVCGNEGAGTLGNQVAIELRAMISSHTVSLALRGNI